MRSGDGRLCFDLSLVVSRVDEIHISSRVSFFVEVELTLHLNAYRDGD